MRVSRREREIDAEQGVRGREGVFVSCSGKSTPHIEFERTKNCMTTESHTATRSINSSVLDVPKLLRMPFLFNCYSFRPSLTVLSAIY